MKKIFAALLALAILFSFAGCDLPGGGMEKLAGQWEMTSYLDTDTATEILEDFEFYPEEIALMDTGKMACIQMVEFTQEKTYRFFFDVDASLAYMDGYYRDGFAAMYQGRDQLVSYYGEEITALSEAEFQQYFAELFGMTDFDTLVSQLCQESFDLDYLSKDFENGTFTLSVGKIYCTVDGEDHSELLEYTIDGDTLTLVYADGEEVYTKR